MWLKYQQANAKMASFDPREIMKKNEGSDIKYPMKRFEATLDKSLRIIVPSNLIRLKKHKNNIEKYVHTKNWEELNKEQMNASRTAQQLKATIRELDNIKYQLNEEDLVKFEKRITPIKLQSIEAIKEFANVEQEIKSSIKETDTDVHHTANHHDVDNTESSQPDNFLLPGQLLTQQLSHNVSSSEEVTACNSWDELRESLLELNSLVKDFAVVVHQQQEHVDRIEENIETAHANVHAGTTYLGQASKYKAAVIPIGGAVVGGLVGGPIGMLAGFKLAGLVASVGGAVAGYQGCKYIKRRHDEKVDIELSHLHKKEN